MAPSSAIFCFVLLLSSSVQSFNPIDSFTIRNLMRERHQQQMKEAEVLDAARNDIINALVNQLTSVMNEEEQNELSNFPLVDAKRLDNGQEVWPIFARGGDYGPRYDVMHEEAGAEAENENFDEKNDNMDDVADLKSPSQTYVEALSKKDLESLLHQPDPSLTVQNLPRNPQISFRKGVHNENEGEDSGAQTSAETSADGQHPVGMKEIVLQSRSSVKRPGTAEFSRELRRLAKEARSRKTI